MHIATRLIVLANDFCGWTAASVERYLVDFPSLPTPSTRDCEARGLLILRALVLGPDRLDVRSAVCAALSDSISAVLNGDPWELKLPLPWLPSHLHETDLTPLRQLNLALAYFQQLASSPQEDARTRLGPMEAQREIARIYERPFSSVGAALTAERKLNNSLVSVKPREQKRPWITELTVIEPPHAADAKRSSQIAALRQLVGDCGLLEAPLREYQEFLTEARRAAGLQFPREDLILFVMLRYFCKLVEFGKPLPLWLEREVCGRLRSVLHGSTWDSAFPLIPTSSRSIRKLSVHERNLEMAYSYTLLTRDPVWRDPLFPERPPIRMTPGIAKKMLAAEYCVSVKTIESALRTWKHCDGSIIFLELQPSYLYLTAPQPQTEK